MAVGSQWKFGADASEYKRVVREMPSEMDRAASKIEGRTKQMSGKVSAFMGELGSIIAGGAIVSGLTGLLKKMDDISDGARRIGISTVEFQKIGNAAELVGTSVEAVNKAMIRAGVAANKAAREGGSMAEAFARANLDPAKFAAAGLEERIKMVAEAQRAANGDAQKMSQLFEAIGVKAAGIDFSALAEEMANVNAASDETVQALARANDELDKAKQNATIFGANLLRGISDASEAIGNLLGGGPGDTNAQAVAEAKRANAEHILRTEGKLLPDDTKTVFRGLSAIPGDDVSGIGAVPERVKGPNAIENDRRIEEKLRALEAEAKAREEAARAAKDQAEAEKDVAAATGEKAKQEGAALRFKQYMLEIDLKIKEAQAEGNKEREAQLSKLKSWTEAAIKYEGDFDMAARDVNATLKERNRLREQELAKQQASIEAELKHVEAMAFGTDEVKKKTEWMAEYNRRIAGGATEEQARRFANAATYEQPPSAPTGDYSGGGGGGGGGGVGGGIGYQSENDSFNMRVGDLKGRANQSRYEQRAADYASRGHYRSAISAMDRGMREYNRQIERARIKEAMNPYAALEDHLTAPDGASIIARDLADAYKLYQERTPLKGRMSQREFEQYVREQARSDIEKKKDVVDDKGGRGKNDPVDGMPEVVELATEATLKLILDKIKERPILVA